MCGCVCLRSCFSFQTLTIKWNAACQIVTLHLCFCKQRTSSCNGPKCNNLLMSWTETKMNHDFSTSEQNLNVTQKQKRHKTGTQNGDKTGSGIEQQKSNIKKHRGITDWNRNSCGCLIVKMWCYSGCDQNRDRNLTKRAEKKTPQTPILSIFNVYWARHFKFHIEFLPTTVCLNHKAHRIMRRNKTVMRRVINYYTQKA